MPKSTEFKVRMDPATKKEIETLAAELGITKSRVVREGVRALKREHEKRAALEDLKKMAEEDLRLLRQGRLRNVRFGLR